jgi:hypothetical protein
MTMGTMEHRKRAEECVAMAELSGDNTDKLLWLVLAQSWVRLAEDVTRIETSHALQPDDLPGDDDQRSDEPLNQA